VRVRTDAGASAVIDVLRARAIRPDKENPPASVRNRRIGAARHDRTSFRSAPMKRFEPLPAGISSPYSYAEIPPIVGCNPSTLTRRFAQAIKRGRATGTAGTVREGAAR
jgi:hypothetical protein